MAVNTELVDVVSGDVHVLKDTVEYHWYVGCTGTAVGMVIGYWDRNGYDDLIFGDSSFYSADVKNAIGSPEHWASYFNEFNDLTPDASELGGAHQNNSIADFLYTSRSAFGLGDGWTWYGYEGIGVHGWASHQGYDNFRTSSYDWGAFSFADIQAEIDAGRPVILSVDSNADGRNDHNVVVFGFDASTNQLLIHDGWERTEEMRWIDFARASEGQEFGITAATWVRPGENLVERGTNQYGVFSNDGSGSAAFAKGTLDVDGTFDSVFTESESGLSRTLSLSSASYDGHTFYRLYNDRSGTAALYEVVAYGDGNHKFVKLSDNSGLSRTGTIDFATADGELFYQLVDDGSGTAALYLAELQDDGTFEVDLLNANSGISRNAVGLSTVDGETFTVFVDDGSGTASSFFATLGGNGVFALESLAANSGVSRSAIGVAEWVNETPPPPPPQTYYGTDNDDQLSGSAADDTIYARAGSDRIQGSDGSDIIYGGGDEYDQVNYQGRAEDYTFIRNDDGSVTVSKPDGETDTLYDIDGFWFVGEAAWYAIDSLTVDAGAQNVTGTSGNDRLSGTRLDDTISGLEGADVIRGSGGNDVIDGGGSEYDQVDYDGSSSDYTFIRNGDGSVTVFKPDGGVDTLTNIDGFWFIGELAWKALDDVVETAERIDGTSGDDFLVGTDGDNFIFGEAGRDVFLESGGDDVIYGGGDEYDQMNYFGSRDEYDIARQADGTLRVEKADGSVDILHDIDGFWFGDSAEWFAATEFDSIA